jgi:hypothetical protein
VTITIGGDYYTGTGKSTVAVVDPTDAISANFRILHNGAEGSVSAHPKYKSNGGLQGDFGYSEPGVSVDATALQALSVVGDTAVLDALVSVNGVSGYKARAVFTSDGGSGKNDQFSLQVTDGNGNIVPALTFGPVGLTRGNMQVH